MQKVLVVMTNGGDLRSDIEGWDAEDADLVKGQPRWKVLNMRVPSYESVLHALADGWRLLAPPSKIKDMTIDGAIVAVHEYHEWWLVKD